jgi:hypothetical protein
MAEFRTYIGMVLTVLPRPHETTAGASGVLSGTE